MSTLYFDHNATTPLDPLVLEAMLPYMGANFANASATYTAGREARRAVEQAREQVAAAIDADPSEVIFTASGSEANNLLVRGYADAWLAEAGKPAGVACTSIEHPCVAEPVRALGRAGWAVSELAVNESGVVDMAGVSALPEQMRLLSVMSANNETGVLQPVAQLAGQFKADRDPASCFHTDAVQAFGKHPLSFRQLNAAGVDALTLSAHKIGGPKGAAALVRDRQLPLMPLVYGGGQEQGLRSGTENVAAIVGFGVACARAATHLEARIAQARSLQQHLESWLKSRGAVVFSHAAARLPNTTFAAFPGIDGETLVSLLDRQGIAISSGAACGSGKDGVSAVLLAMGVDPLLAKGAIRISLGMMPYGTSTIEDVDRLLGQLDKVLSQLQRFAAVA
ncbi:MAG: cysteine desulfurase family protein [Fluviibacter sp.]